jgi:RNase H-fold protein (predicted Holliday junction resolvase)
MALLAPSALLDRLLHPLASRRGLLAIDYGTRKCGFAVAGTLTAAAVGASVLRPLLQPGMYPDAAYTLRVKQLLMAHPSVGGIIVGWPLDPEGRETAECRAVQRFAAGLTAAGVHLPIAAWDERGTSAAARQQLREGLAARRAERSHGSGGNGRGGGPGDGGVASRIRFQPAARRRQPGLPPEYVARVDETAAVLILQGFLDWAAAQETQCNSGVGAHKQPAAR